VSSFFPLKLVDCFPNLSFLWQKMIGEKNNTRTKLFYSFIIIIREMTNCNENFILQRCTTFFSFFSHRDKVLLYMDEDSRYEMYIH